MTDVILVAYGCRHGTHPAGLTRSFDVRSLSNPHHDRALRALTGFDAPVIHEVSSAPGFERVVLSILDWCLEVARHNPPDRRRVGVYCTGGRHRSVVVANEVARLVVQAGWRADVVLRDRSKWV